MPSCSPDVIPAIIKRVAELNPSSILDLGIGFGKWGFLCREYLEIPKRVIKKEDWTVRIDGIEVWAAYVQFHQHAVYNEIFYFDLDSISVRNWISQTKYDFYLAMDVLEHLHYWKEMLDAIPKSAAIIACSPNGSYPQGDEFNNPYERHIQTFHKEDLESYFDEIEVIAGELLCFRKGR